MEEQYLSLPEQISSHVWRATPEPVQRLVKSLLEHTALLENESRLIQFLDATPIGIAVHNATGQLVYINHVGKLVLGAEHSPRLDASQIPKTFQIYREGTQTLYPVEALPSTRALAGESICVDDLELHRGDRVISLEVWATPILDPQGQVKYAIAAFQDISDRKRREIEQHIVRNTLLENERRYHQVIQAQTDLILRSLPDTTITFANHALCQALGLPLENVLGLQWNHFVPPEDWESVSQKITELTPADPIFENINRDYRANEQIGWTQWINLGVFNSEGQLVEIQSVGRDITELQRQIQREQALNRVFQAIRNSLDLKTIFATATAETAQLLKTLDCYVVQYVPDKQVWRQVAEFRHHPDAPEVLPPEASDAENPFAAPLKRWQSVQVLGPSMDARPAGSPYFSGAWLLIPLVVDGKLWGCFAVTTTEQPFAWAKEQLDLAQAVAGQLEVAIQQANLYQQLQLELEERRRVEQALRESEARFQNMAANVPGAIFRYLLRSDGTDDLLYVSPGCYRLWELEGQDAVVNGTLLWQMIHAGDSSGVQASLMQSARTLEPWSWEWRIITYSGRQKWLQASAKPHQNEQGDIIWDGLILDVSDRKRAEAALKESEYRYVQILDSVQDMVFCKAPGSVVVYANKATCNYYGMPLEQLRGITDVDFNAEDYTQQYLRDDYLVFTTGQTVENLEEPNQRADGETRYFHTIKSPVFDRSGKVVQLVGVSRDITDRKRSEAALRESESRYRLLAENMNDLVCLHELDGRYLYVSPSCESLLGYTYEEMRGQDCYSFIHPEDRNRVHQETQAAAIADKPEPITYRMRQKSGHYIWFETLTKSIVDSAGHRVQLQTTSRDVTERVQVQNQLKHDAVHDALTGLPNRHLLMERLELAINRTKRLDTYHFAVLFLDLDRFKVINDSLGHLVGDQLIVAIAHRLRAILRSVDLAARLGGDEFVILLEDVWDIQEVIYTTERVLAALRTPFSVEGREVYTTSSIGIVLGTKAYTQASHVLRDADIAMYRAKSNGKARYEIFDTEMHAQALRRLHLENDLRQAVESQEFVLHYQPIVALDTGALVGFEALIRWQRPTQGLVFPGEFIAIAEETGLITSLDFWALESACQQLAAWQTAFPDWATVKVSVNLSAQDLRRSDLIAEVDRVLRQTHLEPRCLTLEITESMLIENIESTIDLLKQLKERGVQISIDDFGTGYSSLNYLHRLPVDNLKVDRSFVNQMQDGKRNHQIVKTIVALSDQLELEVIAEGVETKQQLEQLRALGYKLGQGYLFSGPLSADAVDALVTQQDLRCFPTNSG